MCQYFSHDYNARQDIKMRRLQFSMGMSGVGIYWSLVEELYSNDNRLMVSDLKMLARNFGTTLKKVMRVINDFALFRVIDDEYICSDSIEKRLALREEATHMRMRSKNTDYTSEDQQRISAIRRDAANSRWNRAKGVERGANGDAKPMQTDAKANAKVMQADANGDAKPMQNASYNNIYIDNNRRSLTTTSITRMREEGEDANVVAEASDERTGSEINAAILCEGQEQPLRQDAEKPNAGGEKRACDGEVAQVIGQEKSKPEIALVSANAEECSAFGPAAVPSEGRAAAVRQELTALMNDPRVAYQLNAKSGGTPQEEILRLLPEFAGQMELEGNAEHGFKLAMHYAYWLGRKQQYKSQNKIIDRDEQRARAEEERHNSVLQRACELMASSKAGEEPVWPIPSRPR